MDKEDVKITAAGKAGGNSTAKQPRKRIKGLLKKLQDQVEFYFGDANLPKDKFLQQKIAEHPDGYISVDVIAGFNKMKFLSTDRSLVLQAMQNSSLVELSEDSRWVRRCTTLPDTSDTDTRTVYVENLPTSTDHDSLKGLFSVFGSVVYVSLPKHKQSGHIKGFAFIEFSSQGEAKDVIEYFQSPDKISQTPTRRKPSEAEAPPSGEAEKGEGQGDSRKVETVETEALSDASHQRLKRGREKEKDMCHSSEEPGGQPGAKRAKHDVDQGSKDRQGDSACCEPSAASSMTEQSLGATSSSESVATTSAPLKVGSTLEGPESVVTSSKVSFQEASGEEGTGSERKSRKRRRDEAIDEIGLEPKVVRPEPQGSEVISEASVTVEGKKKKRNRQHKKKDKWSALRELNLRVLSKSEWLDMKKVYRNLQKEHMKQLKSETKSAEGSGAGGGREGRGFVAHCLVKVVCTGEEMVSAEQLQGACLPFGEVAYVDFRDGDLEGYVRYCTSDCVDKLLEADAPPNITFSAVEEAEERGYFLRTQAARKQGRKVTSKGKRKMRGQDKIISKALQRQGEALQQKPSHIRFSDSETSDVEES